MDKLEHLPIFVYGTLLAGHPNFNKFFAKIDVTIGKAIMRDVVLCKPQPRTPFPYMVRISAVPDPVRRGQLQVHAPAVTGQLLTFGEKDYAEVVSALDWLEGVPNHYDRSIMYAEEADGTKRKCYVYTLPDEFAPSLFFDPVIADGDWAAEVRRTKVYQFPAS